jgi:GNAT superfamily N-acetyltransferase
MLTETQTTQTLNSIQKEIVRQLWNDEYPAQLQLHSMEDLEHYLNGLGKQQHFFIMDGSSTVAWAFLFEREKEKWFATIVKRSYQGKGLGKYLLNKLKAEEADLNGWVIDHDSCLRKDGSPYSSPLGFYLMNGFDLEAESRLETEKISAVRIRFSGV